MPRKTSFALGEYYHLYSRGTEKRRIFLQTKDYERFLVLLYLANSVHPVHVQNLRRKSFEEVVAVAPRKTYVDLCAYCLMPNHFHIIVRASDESGIGKFMQKLLTAYTMYFNIRNNRTGTLFEGRYKARHVQNDEYLRYLISYIHLNPIKIIDAMWKENGISDLDGAEKYISSYKFSSYPDYSGQLRPEASIIEKSALPNYFQSARSIKDEVHDWLTYRTI